MKRILSFTFLLLMVFALGTGCNKSEIKHSENVNNQSDEEFVNTKTEKQSDNTKSNIISEGVSKQQVEDFVSIKTNNQFGNTNANIINKGLACIKDEWIYYSTAEGLFRMKNDGSEQEKINLCEDIENHNIYITNLNVFDEYIFFRNFVKGFDSEYIVKSDGSNLRKIDSTGDLYVASGSFYTWDDPIMTKYSNNWDLIAEYYLNGVCSGYTINVCEDWIYYCGEDNDGDDAIQRVSVDGESKEILQEVRTDYMVVDGDYIYYQGYHDHYVYRMKTDGTEHELIFEKPILWNFNVASGWLYYTDREEVILCRVRVDGTDSQKLTSDWAKDINVVGDWIFYLKNSKAEEATYGIDIYCRVKTDGSCYEQLGQISDPDAYTRYYSEDEPQFVISDTTYENYDFDFNDFTGIYTPAFDYTNEEITNITMASDGTVTGSVTAYGSVTQWAGKRPYMMEENSDGSITFRVQDTPEFSEFYILYPAGVKDRNDMFDSNKIRIEYIISGGGIIGYTYYKNDEATEKSDDTLKNDSTAKPIVNHNGVDWVSQDVFTSKIGASFVSGTGIPYKVIAEERNDNAGRIRTILETDNGSRFMVPNSTSFQLDVQTGICYFDIYVYESSPDYVAY